MKAKGLELPLSALDREVIDSNVMDVVLDAQRSSALSGRVRPGSYGDPFEFKADEQGAQVTRCRKDGPEVQL